MANEKNIVMQCIAAGKSIYGQAARLGESLLPTSERQITEAAVASQGVIRSFEHRLALAADLPAIGQPLADDEKHFQTRTSWTAYSLIDEGVAAPGSLLEVRTMLPERALYNASRMGRAAIAVAQLRDILRTDYEVETTFSSHPIMPSKEDTDNVPVADTWRTIAGELDGYRHQIPDLQQRRLGMVILAEPAYARQVFKNQLYFEPESLEAGQLLVLSKTGTQPHENLLLPPRKSGELEARELLQFSPTAS